MAAPTPEATTPIVVTAQRSAEAALAACLARHCPPREDIDASLALAEKEVEAGEYRAARRTLRDSLHRNGGEAKALPVPVSDLWRADAKVASHLGFDEEYQFSTVETVRALKAGLPKEDYRVFGARMEYAAMLGRLKGHDAARRAYEDLASDARKAGRRDIAAMADLRAIMNHYPPEMREKLVRRLAASEDPAERAGVLEARLALLNIAKAEKNVEQVKLLTSALAEVAPNRPVLVYAPPYEVRFNENDDPATVMSRAYVTDTAGRTRLTTMGGWSETKRLSDHFDDMWIDVGFWVGRDGKVTDLQVLRNKGDTTWAEPLLASIRGRLYTPGNGVAADSYRVERYTWTAGYADATGSHLQRRSPQARIEFLDLGGDGLARPE